MNPTKSQSGKAAILRTGGRYLWVLLDEVHKDKLKAKVQELNRESRQRYNMNGLAAQLLEESIDHMGNA